MKKFKLVTAVALCSISTLSFAATLHSLDKKQMTKGIEDKTITTIQTVTMDQKLIANSMNAYFGKDGKLTGKLANTPESGPQSDEGKWEVKSNGELCATWQHWNNAKPICVIGYELKNGTLLVNASGNTFETFIINDSVKSGNQVS